MLPRRPRLTPTVETATPMPPITWEYRHPEALIEFSDDRRSARAAKEGHARFAVSTPVPLQSEVTIRVDESKHKDSDSIFVGVTLDGSNNISANCRAQAVHLFDGRLCQFSDASNSFLSEHMVAEFVPKVRVGGTISIRTVKSWGGAQNEVRIQFAVQGDNNWKKAIFTVQGEVRIFVRFNFIEDAVSIVEAKPIPEAPSSFQVPKRIGNTVDLVQRKLEEPEPDILDPAAAAAAAERAAAERAAEDMAKAERAAAVAAARKEKEAAEAAAKEAAEELRRRATELGFLQMLTSLNVAEDATLKTAVVWCDEKGATSVSDIVECDMVDDFVRHLGLKPIPDRRLRTMLQAPTTPPPLAPPSSDPLASSNSLQVAEDPDLAEAIRRSLMEAKPQDPVARVRRWGDGLDAPAAGARNFVPQGFEVTLDVPEAIARFGHSASHVTQIMDAGRAKAFTSPTPLAAAHAAALYAYTEETTLYGTLNYTMRTPHTSSTPTDNDLKRYADYLTHMSSALGSLPTHVSELQGKVYRGIKVLLNPDVYAPGKRITWQAFSSSTKKQMATLEFVNISGRKLSGSLFIIDSITAKDIRHFSAIPSEEEVLFPPNSQFKVEKVVTSEQEKKALLNELSAYDMTDLDVYVMKQMA